MHIYIYIYIYIYTLVIYIIRGSGFEPKDQERRGRQVQGCHGLRLSQDNGGAGEDYLGCISICILYINIYIYIYIFIYIYIKIYIEIYIYIYI